MTVRAGTEIEAGNGSGWQGLALILDDVAVDRGERRVVAAVSCVVRSGEAVAVVGPNGAGKSTLLRAVAGLLPLAAGRVAVEGAEPPARHHLHLVAHQNAVKPAQTAFANLSFWCAVLGRPATEVALEAALDRVGLLALADSPAELMSQGQRRRLALARLVAAPRPVWLLDEPTAGLDVRSRATFAAILAGHLAEGGIALAATHDDLAVPARELSLA